MTLPFERVHAILRARDLLLELCEPGKKMTKKEIRHAVRGVLKHYPLSFDLQKISECPKCSQVIGKEWV